jgi:hypothetical protein
LTAAALATADIFDVEAIASDTAEAAFNFLEDSLPSENPLADSSLPSNPLTDSLETPAEKKSKQCIVEHLRPHKRQKRTGGNEITSVLKEGLPKKGKRKSKRNLRRCETCTYQRVVYTGRQKHLGKA